MEIETWRVHIFAAMGEAHGEMRFVGPLVGGKAGVAINAKQGSAGAARVGSQMPREIVERTCEIRDELQRGLSGVSFVFIFVREEPIAVVIALQASQEAEKFGSEIGWHSAFAVILLKEKRRFFGSASLSR